LGNANPGGNGAWHDANSNGSGLPGQLNDCRGVPFKAIARDWELGGNGSMAFLRKSRLPFLCAISLLVANYALAAPENPARASSWFDQQLKTKTDALLSQAHSEQQRNILIAIGLVDEIWGLRDEVSSPKEIDAVLSSLTADSAAAMSLRMEAKHLAEATMAGTALEDDQEPKTSLQWAAENDQQDIEVLTAAVAIKIAHRRHNFSEAERAAELAHSAEAWYRASLSADDSYHRFQSARRALDLDSNYVPVCIDLARHYFAQGQLTRARSILTAVLDHTSEEVSVSALLAEMEINQGRGSVALSIMNELRSKPLPIAVARNLANGYAQLGFVREARDLAAYALKLHPNGQQERELVSRLDEQAGNSVALARNHESKGSHDIAEEQVEADEHDTAPDDPHTERLRRLLNGETVSTQDTSRTFLADVSELIQRWRGLPAAKRTGSRVLADIRVDQLRSDYQTIHHVQLVIAVGSASDVPTYRTRTIQYSPQTQQLSVSRARIYRGEGRSIEADDLGESPVTDESIAAYYDLRARQYRFRDLNVGDVIELEYTITPVGNANAYGHYFADLIAFGGVLPCDLQRFVLRAPVEIHLSSAEHLLSHAQLRPHRDENIYVWEKSRIAALVREPHSPSWSEQGAYVHVSNFQSWQALGKWYADLIRPQFELNAELKNQVSEIVARHPNRLDRVAAIDELVLNNTRYVALEFGVYGFKPYPVTQTFSRRFGDCKDKASLMIALLRAAGIDADIALVRTQRLGDIISKPASVSIFDHAIVYVPEFDLWMDGTAEFASLRELPVEDQGVMALTVGLNGEAVLRRSPRSSAADNYSRRTINARLDADGTIHFSGATYVRGEDAPELRRHLEVRDAKLGYVRDRLAQVLPAVEIHDVELPVGSSEAVSLSFSGDLATFRGHHVATLPSSWMERNYLTTVAPGTSRSQDLLLQAPWTTEEEIHIQLPPGSRVASLPESQTLTSDFGNARLDYHIDGSEITVVTNVQFSQTRIPASHFSAFHGFAASLEKAFHRNIEVELP
jgi:cellulose synthase operon protein C